ncbi:hypothetical protein T05_4986, partial [Trichinella murrelli]
LIACAQPPLAQNAPHTQKILTERRMMAYVSSVPLTSIMTVVYAFMKNAPCYGYISQPVGDIIGIYIKRPQQSE